MRLEWAILVCVACGKAPSSTSKPLAAPRATSPFVCQAGVCRQEHPRLPDTGEWRCAEQSRVVWCAGGEPAAGVVKGAPDPSFRCGPRWGKADGERVCIATHLDYPQGRSDAYHCSYAQELGVARVCRPGASPSAEELPSAALAACWLDGDCRSGRCDRGVCRCTTDAECDQGRCRAGHCAGAEP